MARVVNAKKRQWWRGEFERQAVKAGIYGPGKVCWDTANYLYKLGYSVEATISSRVELLQIGEELRKGRENNNG